MSILDHDVAKLERLAAMAGRVRRQMKVHGALYTLTVALWVVGACQILVIIGGHL